MPSAVVDVPLQSRLTFVPPRYARSLRSFPVPIDAATVGRMTDHPCPDHILRWRCLAWTGGTTTQREGAV